jgi:4-hydroxy-tetrahydrodipicolinate synthase
VTDELQRRAVRLADDVRGTLVAAPVTPRDEHGRIVHLEGYASAIAAGTDGVCVWAHTSRGLDLSDAERKIVLTTFRTAYRDRTVLAAVGPPAGTPPGFETELAATIRLAEQAAALGADGLMVYPLPSLHASDTRAVRTIRLHAEVAAASGLPVAGFLLYAEAGGVPYDPGLLTDLAARSEVYGVKLATLSDAVGCQDAIAAVHAGGALAITGEDRMFGPSLMWGADAALVGIAAATTEVSRRLVRAWYDRDPAGFLAASARLDRLAAILFRDPVGGYVQRMLWLAECEGIVPASGAYDPQSVPLPAAERASVRAGYDALTG